MSEISVNTLSITKKFSWLFSLPNANVAIALLRTRLRTRRTCGHMQEDNFFWQSSKPRSKFHHRLIYYCSLPNIPFFLLIILKFVAMLSEIINKENAGTMDHETPIVIHVISCTFGGFVRIVHSSSCSAKAMSGLLRTSSIFLCHSGDLFRRLEFITRPQVLFTCSKLDSFPYFVNKRHDRHSKLRNVNSVDVKKFSMDIL
jgi:hypothetical protein